MHYYNRNFVYFLLSDWEKRKSFTGNGWTVFRAKCPSILRHGSCLFAADDVEKWYQYKFSQWIIRPHEVKKKRCDDALNRWSIIQIVKHKSEYKKLETKNINLGNSINLIDRNEDLHPVKTVNKSGWLMTI